MRSTKIATEYQATIDRQAEALGEAEERFYRELHDVDPPTTRLAIEREYRAEAIRRGLSLSTPRYCYAKMRSIEAWERICIAFTTGNVADPPAWKRYPSQWKFYPRKRYDLAYKAEIESRRPAPGKPPINPRHVARAEVYREGLRTVLATYPEDAALSLEQAGQLSGIPSRTLHNVASRGELAVIPGKSNGRYAKLVQVGELRRFIHTLLSV